MHEEGSEGGRGCFPPPTWEPGDTVWVWRCPGSLAQSCPLGCAPHPQGVPACSPQRWDGLSSFLPWAQHPSCQGQDPCGAPWLQLGDTLTVTIPLPAWPCSMPSASSFGCMRPEQGQGDVSPAAAAGQWLIPKPRLRG